MYQIHYIFKLTDHFWVTYQDYPFLRILTMLRILIRISSLGSWIESSLVLERSICITVDLVLNLPKFSGLENGQVCAWLLELRNVYFIQFWTLTCWLICIDFTKVFIIRIRRWVYVFFTKGKKTPQRHMNIKT